MNSLKNSKKITLILSFLLLFLIIGSASAADDKISNETISTTTDKVVNVDNDEQVSTAESKDRLGCNGDINSTLKSSNDDVLGDDDAGTFKDLNTLKCTDAGATLVLNKNDSVMNESSSVNNLLSVENKIQSFAYDGKVHNISEINLEDYTQIYLGGNFFNVDQECTLKSNILIDGEGATIDAHNNGMRTFISDSQCNNITLKNIIFVNNNATSNKRYGAAISFSCSLNDVIIHNCTFKNIYNPSNGGSIGFDLNLDVTNVVIDDCKFYNSSAKGSGGAINHHAKGAYNKVTNCYFENCAAAGNGGAIEFYSKYSTIENCTFINIKSKYPADALSWGGVGGAIVLLSRSDYVNITNCNFENCTGLRGGAIASSNVDCRYTCIFNCNFSNCSANDGGAIYTNAAYLNVSNAKFIDNKANNGGSIFFNAQEGTMNNCEFNNNNATNGGALFFAGSDNKVNHCNFINNTATTGGAVYANAAGSSVDSCTFKNCTATSSCNYFYQDKPINFINTYFPEVYVGNDDALGDNLDVNSLGSFSSGMQLVETGGTMYIVGNLTNFQNHEVTRGITIKGYSSSSSINLAGVSGRAFNISSSDVTIRDLTFTGSKYNGDGGVLYWNGDNAYIYNCIFQNNKLSSTNGKGGVIYITGDSDIFSVEKCSFKSNNAYDGGAIYVDDVTDNTLIYDSVFTGNYVTHYGGALYYEGSICYYVDENTNRDFSGNFAGGDSSYANIYDGEATKCILDVYVSLNGDGDGSTFNTPTNFKNGFKLVAPNGKLTFVRENEIFNLGEDYRISKFNVTFIGNHSTLNDASFTITTTSHDIKFYNLIFTGNSEYTIIWNGVDGIVENCIFKDNGGNNGLKGVAIQAYGDNLQVKNSIFNNNRALSNGADGGAIWCNATNLKIINSNFTNNKASAGGIHVYLAESATYTIIKDSSFINGTRTGTGSAIILTNGTIMITSSVFEKNSGVYGGALRLLNGTATVNASTFTSNEATTYGGAIYSNVPLTLTYSNFTSNTATTQGGGLYLTTDADNTYIEDCNFTDNQAYNAGAVSCFAKASISGCNFKHNIATYVGGAAILNANVTVSNSNFTDNIAHTAGGAISIANADGNLTFIDCNFTSNQAIGSSTSAGAIYLYAGSLTISNCDFTSNNANNGGAIRISRLGVNTQISGSNFTNNNATSGHGGAIYTDSPLDISDSNLDGNNATVGGGALYLSGNVIKSNINDCNFTANTACINGGAIFIDGNNVTVINSKFTKNIATENGGAIYVAKNNAIITGCEFKENKAKNGSAIYIRDNVASATITDCNFTDNVAAEHGTVYLKGITSPLKLSNNVFSGNSPVGASENYYENPTITTASVMYVSSSGTGSGLTWDDPTDWNTALGRLENPGKIVLVSDISIASQTFTNQNITVTSYGDVRRKLSSSGKYLFIPLSQFI